MSRAANRPARGLLLAEGGLKLGDRVMSPLELELESLHKKHAAGSRNGRCCRRCAAVAPPAHSRCYRRWVVVDSWRSNQDVCASSPALRPCSMLQRQQPLKPRVARCTRHAGLWETITVSALHVVPCRSGTIPSLRAAHRTARCKELHYEHSPFVLIPHDPGIPQ